MTPDEQCPMPGCWCRVDPAADQPTDPAPATEGDQ